MPSFLYTFGLCMEAVVSDCGYAQFASIPPFSRLKYVWDLKNNPNIEKTSGFDFGPFNVRRLTCRSL